MGCRFFPKALGCLTRNPLGLAALSLLALFLIPATALADNSLDLLMEGFDAGPAAPLAVPEATKEAKKERVAVYGSLTLSAMARTRPRSRDTLARLETDLDLMARGDIGMGVTLFAAVNASHDLAPALGSRFSNADASDVEWQTQFRELWVEKALTPWLDLKLGRQIIAWGHSEVFRLVDVVNPGDQRLPGYTDVEDLRLARDMVRADLYSGPWNLTLALITGDQMAERPVWGSDFYPSPVPLAPGERIDTGLDRPGFAAALSGRFSGWDAGLYLAKVHGDTSYLTQDSTGLPIRCYPKIFMAGATLTRAWGNVLLKSEAAVKDGLRFSTPGAGPGHQDYRRLDILAGMEYSGFTDTTLTAEVVNYHIFDPDPALAAGLERLEKNHVESAFRLARDFRNDTVHLTLVCAFMGAKGNLGSFQRAELAYDWSDTLFFKIGAVVYHSGKSRWFKRVADNDRIFFSVQKDFG